AALDEQATLGRPKSHEHDHDERSRSECVDVGPCPDRRSYSGHDPDGGGGREPDDRALALHDRTGAEKTDARHNLRRDARRVSVRMTVGTDADLRDVDGELSEERGPHADQNIRT